MIVLHKTNLLGVVCEINDISNNALSASKPMCLGYELTKIRYELTKLGTS